MYAPPHATLDDLSDVRALLDTHAALRRLPTPPSSGGAAASAGVLALLPGSPALSGGARSPPTARELCFANALHATQARAAQRSAQTECAEGLTAALRATPCHTHASRARILAADATSRHP
jgi:hypothetical protein